MPQVLVTAPDQANTRRRAKVLSLFCIQCKVNATPLSTNDKAAHAFQSIHPSTPRKNILHNCCPVSPTVCLFGGELGSKRFLVEMLGVWKKLLHHGFQLN
eukprot:5362727-Amphidinium_carterae.1